MSRAYQQAVCMQCSNKMKQINWWDAKEWFYNVMGCTLTDPPRGKIYYKCHNCNTVEPENHVRIAVCYHPYRLTTFKFWDGPDIENSLGVFHMTAEKYRCENYFRFEAKQIGVRHEDKLFHVNSNLERVRFPVVEKIRPFWKTGEMIMPEIRTVEIELEIFHRTYQGNIGWLKRVYKDAQKELRGM